MGSLPEVEWLVRSHKKGPYTGLCQQLSCGGTVLGLKICHPTPARTKRGGLKLAQDALLLFGQVAKRLTTEA